MADERIELPVFELPLTALPSERVPLHIFEDRYKQMIAHCLETESDFGIVLRTDAGAHAVGCAAEVAEVLERFDDGRLNVLVTGRFRFRVLDRYDGDGFPMATVEPIADPGDTDADPSAAISAYRRLLDAVGAEAEPEESPQTAYGIAAKVEIPVETKQQLLESNSEQRRLELLSAALDELTTELERSRAIAELARGNGHAPIDGLSSPDA